MIRHATVEDINTIIELGRLCWDETRYSEFTFDENKIWECVYTLITDEDGIVLLYENEDGEVIGGILAEIFTHFFGQTKASLDLTIFIHPDHRGSPAIFRLIKRYIGEAKQRKVEDIMISISSNLKVEHCEKMFERLGFKQIGSLFSLEDN